MLPAVFEPAVPASDRPQTLALDRSAIAIGIRLSYPGHHVPYRKEKPPDYLLHVYIWTQLQVKQDT